MKPILTAKVGTNADLFPDILKMYVPEGSWILDMTYGKGVFWKNVDLSLYTLVANDLDPTRGEFSYDFTDLPEDWTGKADAVIFDPPYLYTGGFKTLKDSIDRGYNIKKRAEAGIRGVPAVHQMYAKAYCEAYRVVRPKGIFIVKCMDQVMSGKQTWMHIEMMRLAEILGWKNQDLFVLQTKGTPTMRHKTQKHARRNHSYFLVFIK